MAASQDTEITLGTGKVLFLFFGLVALCAAFFGLGFKMGKGSATPITVSGEVGVTSAAMGSARPSAVKPATNTGSASSPDLAFYKTTSVKPAESQPTGNDTAGTTTSGIPISDPAPDPAAVSTAVPPTNGYYVQVAAVSRQEDGDALVDALKKKQYAASSSVGLDKLYHVQVGPFADIKNAEDTRAKLMNDGYNPILKK
jgi:cell division septation protein DedD